MTTLKELPDEAKSLCIKGIWSLYSLKNNSAKYAMITASYSSCCNPNGKQEIYLLNEDGKIVGHAGKMCEIEIDKHVRLG